MTSSANKQFVFEFTDYVFVDKGELTELPELRLWGRITQGQLVYPPPVPVIIPTASGQVSGDISMWMDSLDFRGTWTLGFYTRINPENMSCPFSLCITGVSSSIVPTCPGTAYFATQTDTT